MVLNETSMPPGFATKGVVWLVVVIAWAVATVWIDRDARRLFGRSSPWSQLLAAIGAGLFLGGFNWGMRIVEPLALFLAMVCGFYAVLRGTKAGWQPRSGPLAAVAGVVVAPVFVVDPRMWLAPLVTMLAIVVLGGLGSLKGSLIGALIIGYVEAITVFAVPAGAYLKGAIALSIMIVVLLVRPEGLFGVAFEEER